MPRYRPILTLVVSIDEAGNLGMSAQRHGIMPSELWAAGGFAALNMQATIAKLLGGRPVPVAEQTRSGEVTD